VLAADGRFGNYTCGVTTDARGYCWGENTEGYLGDGTTTSRSTPVPIASPM
jgi:alpha-tubulin suppressor-like RCC1 family protein